MFNWTKVSTDPNNTDAQNQFKAFISSTYDYYDSKESLILNSVKNSNGEGKRVLDIGIVEHDISYVTKPEWLHRKIAKAASYSLGIDILPEYVDYIRETEKLNVACADATSDLYLGEKFDLVIIGDVIEHVDNPAKLLLFAKRHLNPDGEILVSTPNPLSIQFMLEAIKYKHGNCNLDHTCFFVPSNINELCRRTGLQLSKCYLEGKNAATRTITKKIIKSIIRNLFSKELVSVSIIYSLTLE